MVVVLGFAARHDYLEIMSPPSDAFDVTLLLPDRECSIRVPADEHIWDAAFSAGLSLPALCHQGYCLTCTGRLEGEGEVDQSDSRAYFPEDSEAGFVLLCTGKPRSNLRIRTHQQMEMRQHRRANNLLAPYSWTAG
jgi:ferredoxin